jgi:glycosyltransferase involved in cell wall biosynthesis
LRILTVTHFFESHGGGIERVAGHLCRQFARLGATAAWAASDSDAPPASEVEPVLIGCVNPTEKLTGLPMPIPGIRGIRTLTREVRRSDAVVVHDALYVTSILALLIAKAHGKRVILIQHIAAIPFSSLALRTIMGVANLLVTRPMLSAADARVFISDTVRRDLLGDEPSSDFELLFNGVDSLIFPPSEGQPSAPEAVAGIDIPTSSRRILFVGRYVEKKGLDIIRALAASRLDLSFFLVGSGPIRPSEWRLANVHDLGAQNQETLAELYRWSDLLLLPSVGEGYPLVIQEAMACALPVVCGEPVNRADPDAAGWLKGVRVDLSDPDGSARRFAEAIDSFSLSAEERAAMSRYALRRYDWNAMARGVLALAERRPARALA